MLLYYTVTRTKIVQYKHVKRTAGKMLVFACDSRFFGAWDEMPPELWHGREPGNGTMARLGKSIFGKSKVAVDHNLIVKRFTSAFTCLLLKFVSPTIPPFNCGVNCRCYQPFYFSFLPFSPPPTIPSTAEG